MLMYYFYRTQSTNHADQSRVSCILSFINDIQWIGEVKRVKFGMVMNSEHKHTFHMQYCLPVNKHGDDAKH
jgi:hypothetical protein